MEKEKFKDIAILFVGFDGYKDVWDHCFSLLNKNWSDRPKTYLACSELQPNYENVEVINAGKDAEWSRKVQVALEKIPQKYVLLMLEDFFVSDIVDNEVFDSVLNTVKTDGIKFYQVLVQLIHQSAIKGESYKGNKNIHIIPVDKKYPLNLQAAIWEKEFLEECVGKENYNAWQFEINQIERTNINRDRIEFLIDDRNICNITHTIVQSKYLPGAVKSLKKKGYIIGDNDRECLSKVEYYKYMLKLYMYEITPGFLVKPAKAIGKMLKVDFVTDRLSRK